MFHVYNYIVICTYCQVSLILNLSFKSDLSAIHCLPNGDEGRYSYFISSTLKDDLYSGQKMSFMNGSIFVIVMRIHRSVLRKWTLSVRVEEFNQSQESADTEILNPSVEMNPR